MGGGGGGGLILFLLAPDSQNALECFTTFLYTIG